MGLFRKKRSEAIVREEATPVDLVNRSGYSLTTFMVISMADRMIVRVKLRMPDVDNENVEIVALNENRDEVSMRCVYLGKENLSDKVSGFCVFKELTFSVFVPYPEQNLVFEVRRGSENKEVIHQQLVEAEVIKKQRAKDDQVFYRFAEDDPTYTEWLAKEHRPSEYELEVQRNTKLYFEPMFSIVVPLYKTPIQFFNELIKCVENQTYSNWELILVNGSRENVALTRAAYVACQQDARISLVELEKNEGITLNTAYGINIARGDFVCFVDHDDVLEPNCLFEYAQAINKNPEAELLYCDEDLLLPDGSYRCAYFKPDFNEFQLRTSNYICHMLTIKRELLRQLEYDNPEYDGAQDHHLTLQASEKAKAICHVPHVLYHWRMSETSVAGAGSEKPYAVNAGLKAVSTHLDRLGVKANVESHETILLTTKIDYKMPEVLPKVSIVVPARVNVSLMQCVGSILEKTEYPNFEVVIVANKSVDLADFRKKDKIVLQEVEAPFNFSMYVNKVIRKACGEYIVILGDNVEVLTASWIKNMLEICIQPEVAIVGGKLIFPDDTIESAGLFIGDEPYPYFQNLPNGAITFKDYAKQVRNVSAVGAACMMVESRIFDKAEGFNEEMESELAAVDFCFKVSKLKKQIVYTPYVELRHNILPNVRCSCLPRDKKHAIKEVGLLMNSWTSRFVAADPNQNLNIAQGWRGAYYLLRD